MHVVGSGPCLAIRSWFTVWQLAALLSSTVNVPSMLPFYAFGSSWMTTMGRKGVSLFGLGAQVRDTYNV